MNPLKQRGGVLDWLIGILLSWLIPLNLVWSLKVTYFVSLLLWVIPILCVLPRFFAFAESPYRRHIAVAYTALYILVLGAILDFVFGGVVLKFDQPDKYIVPPIRAIGGSVPIEEFLFYATGGLAIVLVYFWADEYWLSAYNVRCRRELIPRPGFLIKFSPLALLTAVVLFAAGIVAKALLTGVLSIPIYFTFLVAIAFTPAVVLFEALKGLVNWRAFSFTALYVMLTSVTWEVTLGIPNFWWRYQEWGMIGKTIDAFSYHDKDGTTAIFPIEALLVWIAVSFSVILFYEAVKAYRYDTRPRGQRLFGPPPW